jgi:hypothetical protein
MLYLGLRTWDPCEVASPQFPYSQRLRVHGLTSSDLRLRTWNPCELALKVVSPTLSGAQKHWRTSLSFKHRHVSPLYNQKSSHFFWPSTYTYLIYTFRIFPSLTTRVFVPQPKANLRMELKSFLEFLLPK